MCAPQDVKKTSQVELQRQNVTLGLGLNVLIFQLCIFSFFRSQQPHSLHHTLPHRSSVCLVYRRLWSEVLVLGGSTENSSTDCIGSLEFVSFTPIFNTNIKLQLQPQFLPKSSQSFSLLGALSVILYWLNSFGSI